MVLWKTIDTFNINRSLQAINRQDFNGLEVISYSTPNININYSLLGHPVQTMVSVAQPSHSVPIASVVTVAPITNYDNKNPTNVPYYSQTGTATQFPATAPPVNNSMRVMEVIIPTGALPGSTFIAVTPEGNNIQVI